MTDPRLPAEGKGVADAVGQNEGAGAVGSARQPLAGPVRAKAARPGQVRTFDHWAASYDLSQLQDVLYGPVHDAVLRYARQHLGRPGRILDVGCGTGRLPGRLASGYPHTPIVGIDASTAMVSIASAGAVPGRTSFAAAAAERLPFAAAAFDLVVVTLSVSHWGDKSAGLAEIRRIMAPGATLVAAGICAAWRSRPLAAWAWHRKPWLDRGLPRVIAASGLHIEHVEQIRSVTVIADVALIAAKAPSPPGHRGCLALGHPGR